MQNWKDTILSQYANSPTIVAIIEAFNECVDPSSDIDNFYNTIWNVATANDAGLDIWGKIVNVSRFLKITETQTFFGFKQELTSQPFNQASFRNSQASVPTQVYELPTESYRTLIMVKAMSNITNCTVPSLNRLLLYLFPMQRAYVQDTGGMSIRYVFEFNLTPVELAILTQSGAIARPAGVGVSIMQVDVAETFGFKQGNGQPFNQGAFFNRQQGITNAS